MMRQIRCINMAQKVDRRNYIDVLKSLASIVIVVYHYKHLEMDSSLENLPLINLFGYIYRYGLYLVEFFFLLSGFVLICQYQSQRQRRTLKEFMGTKIKRLYPVFFITSVMCFLLQFFAYYKTGGFVLNVATNASYLILDLSMLNSGLFFEAVPLNVPAWFLTPLVICYFLFWLIFYRTTKAQQMTGFYFPF